MTSDAKVGLLLGLVFIFIIAFLINGLPNFSDSQDGNNLTRNMTVEDPEPLGIGNKQIDIISERFDGERITLSDNKSVQDTQKSRFQMPLPEISDAIEQVQREQNEDAAKNVPDKNGNGQKEVLQVKEKKPGKPKVYMVKKGDNLTRIAKKFYGPDKGSKESVVKKLFEANQARLESPDKLKAGQKIIIPVPESADGAGIFDSGMFEKVESMGGGYSRSGQAAANKFRSYKVQEGDNLWKIAVRELGNGSRYKDIIKLNRRKLADEDVLKVGMRLRLPAK